MLEMERQAQAEARSIAQNGDAELAKDTLAIREKANQDRMALDEKYDTIRAQASKKQRAAIDAEYQRDVAA